MRRSFWERVEEAKIKEITAEEFGRIESLEAAIAHHQNQIDEYEREIKQIKSKGHSKPKRIEVAQRPTCSSF